MQNLPVLILYRFTSHVFVQHACIPRVISQSKSIWWFLHLHTIQYNTMKNLHSKTDKHTVSLI